MLNSYYQDIPQRNIYLKRKMSLSKPNIHILYINTIRNIVFEISHVFKYTIGITLPISI